MLSNGDLIAQIGNEKGDYLVDSNDTSIYLKNFIARINKETGQLVWANAYFFSEFNDQQVPKIFKVINDKIWAIGNFENSVSNPAGRANS